MRVIAMVDDTDDTELTVDDIVFWMGWQMELGQRQYDVLLALLAALGQSGKAKELQQLHEQGEYLYPPPANQPEEQ